MPQTDFFVSYTNADNAWAQWISYVLEEEGFTVTFQGWDFRPGSNFVLEMQKAATEVARTIMVLSPDYLKSQFAPPEWAAMFAQDPQGLDRKLVPVQVRPCQPTGLLSSIVQIRIAGVDEATARRLLIDGVNQKRAKPSNRPAFPGEMAQVKRKAFPGPASKTDQNSLTDSEQPRPSIFIPPLKRAPSDIEKRRFVRQGFETIKSSFESNLQVASQQEARIDVDFQASTATDFRAELYLDGSSRNVCRIWESKTYSGDEICYSEGQAIPTNGCNESLMLSVCNDDLFFSASMAMGVFGFERSFDLKKLTGEKAAEYLWRRFMVPLERQ